MDTASYSFGIIEPLEQISQYIFSRVISIPLGVQYNDDGKLNNGIRK